MSSSCQPPGTVLTFGPRQVTVEEDTKKATQLNIMFMETSAKAGHNVKSLFKKIAMSLPGMDSKDSTSEGNTSASTKELLPEPCANVTLRNRCINALERRSTRCLCLQLLVQYP